MTPLRLTTTSMAVGASIKQRCVVIKAVLKCGACPMALCSSWMLTPVWEGTSVLL